MQFHTKLKKTFVCGEKHVCRIFQYHFMGKRSINIRHVLLIFVLHGNNVNVIQYLFVKEFAKFVSPDYVMPECGKGERRGEPETVLV